MRRIETPTNWTQAVPGVLLIGWLALAAVKGFSGETLSLFRWELARPPLFLLPPPDSFGLLPGLSLLPVIGLALWIMPRAADPKFWAICFLGYGLAALVLAVGYDIRSGVALYEDRLIYRTDGPLSPLREAAYGDVQTIRTACVNGGRRSAMRVSYEIETPDGARFELTTRQEGMLSFLETLDRHAVQGGARWAPARHARNGRILYDVECVSSLLSRSDSAERDNLRALFRLDELGFRV